MGRLWYIKQNPNSKLTDIEFRIYQTAYKELASEYPIPQVYKNNDPTILVVQSVINSLKNILHTPAEIEQTREQFTDFLGEIFGVHVLLVEQILVWEW